MASMTSLASSTVSEKYSSLRKRLDNFGYRQPLGLDTLQLVERLFSDLIHTTESLRKVKEEASKLTQHHGNVEAHVEPFKQDNARLVRENNEIHLQLIKQKESFEEQLKELKARMRKLEHENEDLRFLNDEYIHKLRQLEAESQAKSERIAELQEKNVRAVVQTPGGRKKQIAFRRQRMEIDALLPDERGDAPTDRSTNGTTINQTLNRSRDADRLRGAVDASKREDKSKALAESERYKVDLLQIADRRIEDLTAQLNHVRDEAEAIERRSRTFKEQVETREREIDRLHKMLDGGRPYDIVALESRNATNERLISHLNMQIDFLQTKNQELERRVEDYELSLKAERRQELELDARNQSLRNELTEVDRMAHKLSNTKDTVIQAADLELTDARADLERLRADLERQCEKVSLLESERKRLYEDADSRRTELQIAKADFVRLDELCKRLQTDKNKLTQRITKLTSNERELVLEIERMKLKGGSRVSRTKSPSRLDVYMRGVEQDRDYYKAECELLQRTLRDLQANNAKSASPVAEAKRTGRTRSCSPSKRLGVAAAPCGAATDSGLETADSELTSHCKVNELAQQVSHYESTIRALENEVTYYKRQVEQQQAQLAASRRARSPLRPLSPPTKERDDFELQRLRQERLDAQATTERLERQLTDLQANSKLLLQDRDKLHDLYEESQKELKRLRQDLVSQPKSPRVSLAAQAILRRVEAERDDTLAELRRTVTERDSLKERLRVATETHQAERSRIEQRIEDIQETLRHTEHERDEHAGRSQALSAAVQSLEEQRKSSLRAHSELSEELQETRANANQLRMLVDQVERALDEAKRRLASKDAEADEYLVKLRADADRLRVVEQTLTQVQAEATHLRSQVANFERRSEQLQFTVDTDREQIQKLDHELKTKEAGLADLRSRLGAHEAQLDRANELLAARERDIKTLRKQFDAQLDETNELKKSRDVTMRENRRAQDDLGTLARENQALQRELQNAIEERERFKQQVQDCMLEIKRVEDLLTSKEQERGDLLEQYRMLSIEADKYETQTHQLESELSNYKLQLLTRESDSRKFRERLEQAESELNEQTRMQQQYEIQMTTLAKSITELEDLLRQSEAEKDDLLKDLQAVRDLCARLETSRDQLQRQLTGKSIEYDQSQGKMDAVLAEMQALRDQIALDKESIRSLETILQSSRDKEFQSQMNVQERGAELQSLRERCAISEAKLETMTREVSNLRARNLELESEIEKMRRQLTNERFERERTIQETRRYTPIGGNTATTFGSAGGNGALLSNVPLASGSSFVRPSSTITTGIGTIGATSLAGAAAVGSATASSDRLATEQRAALLTRSFGTPKSPLRDSSVSALPGALSSTPTSSLTRQLLAGYSLPLRERDREQDREYSSTFSASIPRVESSSSREQEPSSNDARAGNAEENNSTGRSSRAVEEQ